MSKKLRAKIEDELQVLFTCPVTRQERLQQCKSEFDHLGKLFNQPGVLGASDAGDHYEQHVQLTSKSHIIGKGSKPASQRSCAQAVLRSLVISSNKLAGFSQLTQHRTHNTPSKLGLAGFNSPLVVLLRRVSIWYYYHVMYSPAEVLLYISSGCELLFQLLTPHLQLAIMSEIVTTLSSPSMALSRSDGKNAELLHALDTPLHTATFMSMLYMAKQLAVAEAAEHQQQQQQQQGFGHESPPNAQSPFTALHPTALLQLRLARLQRCAEDISQLQEQQQQQQQQQQKQQQPVPLTGYPALITELCADLYEVLQFELRTQQSHDVSHVVLQQPQHSLAYEASVHQQKLLGPLLSQVSKLSKPQLYLWRHIQQYAADAAAGGSSAVEEQTAAAGIHAAAVTAAALHQLKKSLEAAGISHNLDECSPLSVLLLKVMQGQQSSQQQQVMQQQQQDEALAMLHVVSVLLHGIMYEHALDVSRMNLRPYLATCQLQLLLSIHSIIAALLLSAQQHKAAAQNIPAAHSSDSLQGSSSSSDTTSSNRACTDSVWSCIMQQVQAAVLQFVRVRQAMKPQVVYLALEDKLKDVLRRTQHESQRMFGNSQASCSSPQQQGQQQSSAVASSSRSDPAAASSSANSTGPVLLNLFRVLQHLLIKVVAQETPAETQVQQNFEKIASDFNLSQEELAARAGACMKLIRQSSVDLVQQTYSRLYRVVSDSGVLQFRDHLRKTLVRLQPYMVQDSSAPASQEAAKVVKLFCCVLMLVDLQALCSDEHALQHSQVVQTMLDAIKICNPIMHRLLEADACLQSSAAKRQQQQRLYEAAAGLHGAAPPAAAGGSAGRFGQHQPVDAATEPEEGPMRIVGGMGYCPDDSSSSSVHDHALDAQAGQQPCQNADDDSDYLSEGEIGQDVFQSHHALHHDYIAPDGNGHRYSWQQQQEQQEQEVYPVTDEEWRQIAEASWQQQQEEDEESLLSSESVGTLSDSSDLITHAAVASSSGAGNWPQQQQPSWRMLGDDQLRRFHVFRYWVNEQHSLSPRRAWVKLLLQLDISESFDQRLESLVRRLQQREAYEQDPSRSCSNQPCDSDVSDDADDAEHYELTFPEMAIALEKLLVYWQYDDSELQQEGLKLLQSAYDYVLEVLSDTKESADDLCEELEREVAEPFVQLLKNSHSADYYDMKAGIQCFGLDELPLLVKEWSTQLVKIAGPLIPKLHSHGATPAVTEMLQAWDDHSEFHAQRWLDKAGSFLQGLRLMVRLYMRCSVELPHLQRSNNVLSEILEALPEFPLTPAAACEGLPQDDVLYTLFMKLAKQQQGVKVYTDALKASQHCLAVAFGGDVGRCAWVVLHKMLSLVVYADTKGGSWSLVSRDASDKITAVVTRMLSYLHSTTTDLGLPDDFKLQDFELAAATLSADTVEALLGSFEVRGGMQAFYWLFQQLPAPLVHEVARRASGNRMVPKFAARKFLGYGTRVYDFRGRYYSESGVSWDGYERRDELGYRWTGLSTLGKLGSKQAVTDHVYRTATDIIDLKQWRAEMAAAVAASSASRAELEQLHGRIQQQGAVVAAQCHETLLHPPDIADVGSDDESESSAGSEARPFDGGGTGHITGSRTAVAWHGSQNSSNMARNIGTACRFAKLQREHAVAQRLLGLQQQLADITSKQQRTHPQETCRSGQTAATQRQQQQVAWLHISNQRPAPLSKQCGSCSLHLINSSDANKHQQMYKEGVGHLQQHHNSIKAAHTNMQNQLLTREAIPAASAAAAGVSVHTSQLRQPCSGSCSKHGSSSQDPELLLGAQCARTAAAAFDADSSSSYRTLLWQVLVQLKPSVQPWYQQLIAKHHCQQQHGSSSSSSTGTPASVPDQAIPELWDLVGSSVAADILVVPPAFRDLLQNNWAGGAGRLTHSGSNSSTTATAALMLVCQYARAARKKAAKAYDPQQLMMQLMMLQLLATDDDKLAELQPAAAAPVAAALTAATHAAEVGAQPLLAAVAEAQAKASSSSSSSSSVDIYHLAAQYGVLAAPPLLALPWLQFLNSYQALHGAMASDRDLLKSTCVRRSAARDARGVSDCGDDNNDDLGDCGPGFSPVHEPETSLAAAAAVMMSYPCTDHPRLLSWLKNEMERFDEDKVPAVPTSWLPAAVQVPQPQQQQQQQQRQQQQQQQGRVHSEKISVTARAQHTDQKASRQHLQQQSKGYIVNHVNQPLLALSYWLHADRLVSVTPDSWQQYLYDSCSSTGSSSSNKDMQKQLELLVDLCCDWCGERMPPAASSSAAAAAAARDDGDTGNASRWCCAGCGCTQYCSADCAAAAKKVHQNNCWRIVALAADGHCWQQQRRGDKQSRAFFDYSTEAATPA